MEVEKKRSKGGFLNLFDWNGKSRKKLFIENYEFPGLPTIPAEERSNQGTKNVENLLNSALDEIKVTENGGNSSNKVSSDWNSALSMTSDEGSVTRAPGVVARLMGLDSLPSSIVNEACSTSFSGSASPREYQLKGSRGSDSRKMTMNVKNMGQSRSIERFQTEILPRKSAKSMPAITHHKLLSPIKGPGFTQTRNVAYVMEAAAKIIEASPSGTVKRKESIIGHSSTPLRIRDLKVRAETEQRISQAERSKEAGVGKLTKRQLTSKSYNGLENGRASRVSTGSGKFSSESSRINGKAASSSSEAKVNAQHRNDLQCSHNKNSIIRKEPNEVKVKQKRTSLNKNTTVLGQNNQKQNSVPNKVKLNSKTSVSNQSSGKAETTSCSNKTSAESDYGRKASSSTRKNVGQKLLVGQNISSTGSVQHGERLIKYNVTKDDSKKWDADCRNQAMDIVSFTFTSPLKKSSDESRFLNSVIEPWSSLSNADSVDGSGWKNFGSSSLGLDVIHGDALSVLLEQKLQELTCKVESHSYVGVREGHLQDSFASTVTSTARVDEERFQPWLPEDKSDSLFINYSTTPNGLVLDPSQHWQGAEEVGELSGHNNEKTVLTTQFSFDNGSCSGDGNTANYNNKCSSVGDCNMTGSFSIDNFLQDPPFSEAQSPASAGDIFGIEKSSSPKVVIDFKRSDISDLEYVRKIFSSAELDLEDLVLQVVPEFFSSNLLDHLEIPPEDVSEHESWKLKRKILFDCGKEYLDMKCRETVVGSYGSWSRLRALFKGKEGLGEELYREMVGWRDMKELMVDEVVERDMSSGGGRWLNFESEAVEGSVEIENEIWRCLVHELTTELLGF